MRTPLVLLALGLFMLLEPFLRLWARTEAPWYLPYLLWAMLIGAAIVLAQGEPTHDA